ncbi:MAG: glycosyltransferase family 39 protein, partial [Flavobacteriales bacterium]
MRAAISRFWAHPPADALRWVTLIALMPRLVAALFSKGYFAVDDHFLVIEAAASWVDGFDYNHWLPWNQGEGARPGGHSYFYVGLHYLLIRGLKAMGLAEPQAIMVAIRLLHALWSLVAVRAGWRIAMRIATPAAAWQAGLLLALLCYMPFLSVRNLVEVACIPFLMLGALRLVHAGGPWRGALIGGLWIGMAMNVRFQVIFLAAGAGLAYLLQRDWRSALAYGLGALLPLAAVQGLLDLLIWGRPWAELTAYVAHNLTHATSYVVLPWYNYLLLLAGLFIPPLSLAVLFGFFREPKPLAPWLGALLFLAAHSAIPNKQERFLLPIVPLFLVLGYCSWETWRARSAWWARHAGLWNGALAIVWAINLLLLPILSTTYSKRSRVEAMVALRGEIPLGGLVIDDPIEDPPMPPLFYLGQWDMGVFPWGPDHASDTLRQWLRRWGVAGRTHQVLFIGEERIEERIARMEREYGPV